MFATPAQYHRQAVAKLHGGGEHRGGRRRGGGQSRRTSDRARAACPPGATLYAAYSMGPRPLRKRQRESAQADRSQGPHVTGLGGRLLTTRSRHASSLTTASNRSSSR